MFTYNTVEINGQTFPRNRIPMEFYDEWRKNNRGVRAFFRGSRREAKIKYDSQHRPRRVPYECLKEDATHFYAERH